MDSHNFTSNWLIARNPLDEQSRSKIVLHAVQKLLTPLSTLKILDLGAGLGSSFMYLADKISQDQHWIMLENDPTLRTAGSKNLVNWLKQKGFSQQEDHFVKGTKKISFQYYAGSFLDPTDIQQIRQTTPTLITASAFFDIFAPHQIEQFLSQFRGIPLYTSLNYNSMNFSRNTHIDDYFLDTYTKHMRREQVFGRALGNQVLEWFSSKYDIETHDTSTWHLNRNTPRVNQILFQYMKESIPEIDTQTAKLDRWLSNRIDAINSDELELHVHHDDFLIASL